MNLKGQLNLSKKEWRKRISGSNEVAAIGIASVTHQIAIQTVDANMLFPSLDKPSKLKKKNIRTNINGPKMSPNVFFDII